MVPSKSRYSGTQVFILSNLIIGADGSSRSDVDYPNFINNKTELVIEIKSEFYMLISEINSKYH